MLSEDEAQRAKGMNQKDRCTPRRQCASIVWIVAGFFDGLFYCYLIVILPCE